MSDQHGAGDKLIAVGWLALCLLVVLGLAMLAGWFIS
jgi:hypothetical protein